MESRYQYIIAGLVLLNVGGGFMVYDHLASLNSSHSELEETNENLEAALLAATNETNATSQSVRPETTIQIPLYETRAHSGTLINASIRPVPGEGVFLRADDLIPRKSFQESAATAFDLSQRNSEASLYNSLQLEIENAKGWVDIGGKSAGLPLYLGMVATAPSLSYNHSVIATGQVDSSGRLYPVQHIREKAHAAREAGFDKFVVPKASAQSIEGITIVGVQNVTEASEHVLEPAN